MVEILGAFIFGKDKDVKVKCDICDVEFEIDNSKMKVKNVNDIEVNYFECHKCNHKYITSCYDNYVLREQNKLKKLNEKISATTNGKEREKLMIKSQKLLKHLKTHSDRLKMDIEKQWIL